MQQCGGLIGARHRAVGCTPSHQSVPRSPPRSTPPRTPAMASDGAAPAVYQPLPELQKNAYVKSLEEYKKLYEQSLNDPEVRSRGMTRSPELSGS